MLPRPAMSPAVLLAAVACFAVLTLACDVRDSRQGCKIEAGLCSCGVGCNTEYVYANRNQCMDAIRERGNNICSRMPCLNGGSCSQIIQKPGFKCICYGTGYHGFRCDKACNPLTVLRGEHLPYECIVI